MTTLLMLGTNPAYDAPADLGFADLLAKVPVSIHHGQHADETARLATWHVPASHFLEAWNDHRASDGTASIQQPLIAPLYATMSDIELLARVAGAATADGHALVRDTWSVPAATPPSGASGAAAASGGRTTADEATWRRWLHDGVGSVDTAVSAPDFHWDALASAPPAPPSDGIEVDFALDACVFDGRYANNAWLQELPDPITKVTWDNVAQLSPTTARTLGMEHGDVKPHGAPVIAISLGGRTLEIVAMVSPGLADDTVILPLGYGRTAAGRVGNGVGFDTNALRTSAAPWFASGAKVSNTGRVADLATTQVHGSLEEPISLKDVRGKETAYGAHHVRDAVFREATLAEYKADPKLFEEKEIIPAAEVHSLWTEPNTRTGQQWGMSIDLNSCTGCGACTIACQAENNIPTVGKPRVLRGREMHWIRVDRYYVGNPEEARAVSQPIPCMQCEDAPCESVCPVAATAHSPEGLNDMAYNRCIGTRYCANNCPYKVRRFNYFNFTKENDDEKQDPLAPEHGSVPMGALLRMQRNPDVTVRFRGVMEKCTYCVQRVNEAKIDAKVNGDGVVRDGAITPACAQACPTKAIVFGDVSDPESAVSKLKAQARNYVMLRELNTKPRTSYLGRLRNPNPDLAGDDTLAG